MIPTPTFPKRQILNSSKLKGFAHDNFEFDENVRCSSNGSKKKKKLWDKEIYCSLRAISPFPAVFSKDLYCRHVNTRACLGKG